MTCSIRDESAVRTNLHVLFFFYRPSTSHLALGGACDDSQDRSICILLRRIVHELLEALVRHELHFHPILNERRTSAKSRHGGTEIHGESTATPFSPLIQESPPVSGGPLSDRGEGEVSTCGDSAAIFHLALPAAHHMAAGTLPTPQTWGFRSVIQI